MERQTQDNLQKGNGFASGGQRRLLSSYPSWLTLRYFCVLLASLSVVVAWGEITFAREQHWLPVLFTVESKVTLSTCDSLERAKYRTRLSRSSLMPCPTSWRGSQWASAACSDITGVYTGTWGPYTLLSHIMSCCDRIHKVGSTCGLICLFDFRFDFESSPQWVDDFHWPRLRHFVLDELYSGMKKFGHPWQFLFFSFMNHLSG